MIYSEALELIKRSSHLIGKTNERGFIINELIIVPSDSANRQQYIREYLNTKNAELAISPYVEEDVEVWAIDTEHLKNANVLFYERING